MSRCSLLSLRSGSKAKHRFPPTRLVDRRAACCMVPPPIQYSRPAFPSNTQVGSPCSKQPVSGLHLAKIALNPKHKTCSRTNPDPTPSTDIHHPTASLERAYLTKTRALPPHLVQEAKLGSLGVSDTARHPSRCLGPRAQQYTLASHHLPRA